MQPKDTGEGSSDELVRTRELVLKALALLEGEGPVGLVRDHLRTTLRLIDGELQKTLAK